MPGRTRSLIEREQDLLLLLHAVDLEMHDVRPRLDRLVAAVLRERHAPLATALRSQGYPLTWAGVAAAADAATRSPEDTRTATVLDNILDRVMVVAVSLMW
jgi:hypothetical protein